MTSISREAKRPPHDTAKRFDMIAGFTFGALVMAPIVRRLLRAGGLWPTT